MIPSCLPVREVEDITRLLHELNNSLPIESKYNIPGETKVSTNFKTNSAKDMCAYL